MTISQLSFAEERKVPRGEEAVKHLFSKGQSLLQKAEHFVSQFVQYSSTWNYPPEKYLIFSFPLCYSSTLQLCIIDNSCADLLSKATS